MKLLSQLLTVMLAVVVVVLLLFQGLLVSDESTRNAVEKQGYRDVRIESSSAFFVRFRGCSSDDDAAYKMKAVNTLGREVDLVVCAGWPWKGVTVRTE